MKVPPYSRREFVKLISVGSMAGVALSQIPVAEAQDTAPGRAEVAPLSGDRPELLVVSKLGSRHPLLRSFLSQLLERGIHFQHDDQQELPADLPEDWPGYRAIVFDSPAYKAAMARPDLMAKLGRYLVDQGVLFHLVEPADAGKVGNAVYDGEMAETAGIVIMHAALTEQHPALAARQAARSDEMIVADLRNEILQRVEKLREWGEFNNHYWRPAMLLAEGGDDHARELLLRSIRESSASMPTGCLGQSLAGLWGTAWLFRQTGEREPLDKARELLDRVLKERPRTMGVLNWNGLMDDPLGRGRSTRDKGMSWEQPTVAMRKVNWNEALHMQCASLAAIGRGTADPRYLDEALKLIAHCGKYHLDPSDHLLFHATCDGRPVSGKWGRGTTHALYGMIFTAEETEAADPRRREILDLIAQIGEGLRKVQDPATGLWRNETSLALARVETSCTAGIVYVFGRAIVEGWLPRERYAEMVLKGWAGLKRMYWQKGLAAQCRGTAAGTTQHYLSRPQGWGPVPQALMAALMVQRLSKG